MAISSGRLLFLDFIDSFIHFFSIQSIQGDYQLLIKLNKVFISLNETTPDNIFCNKMPTLSDSIGNFCDGDFFRSLIASSIRRPDLKATSSGLKGEKPAAIKSALINIGQLALTPEIRLREFNDIRATTVDNRFHQIKIEAFHFLEFDFRRHD